MTNEIKNGFVRWRHLISVLVTIIIFIAGAIIANDRLRASEDQRIEANMGGIAKELYSFKEETAKNFGELKVSLARIESKIEG